MEFQKWHISVKGLIRCEKSFLLVQEHDELWEAPGGRVDQGELMEVALLREIREELELHLSKENIGQLVGINQRYDYKVGDGWALMTFFYEVNLNEKPEIKLSNEHINFVWVNKETDLNKMNFKNSVQRDIFEKFKESL